MSFVIQRPASGQSHTTVSSLSAATSLSKPHNKISGLLIQTFTESIRVTLDGTAPTASIGFQITPEMGPVIIHVSYDQVIKIIEETASASIQYQWLA